MISVKWVSPMLDCSGYAAATREYIKALLLSGQVNLNLKPVSFEQEKTTHGDFHRVIQGLIDKPVNHKIQVVHLTPENYPTFRDPNCYNIAYTVWETNRLPAKWVELCNYMDEIWVPSKWNVDIFRSSGVIKPIICIPHVIPISDFTDAQSIDIPSDNFMFYTIAQWTARKGIVPLLYAYLTEFKPLEHICLALKSYRLDTSLKEREIIKKDISYIKQTLCLPEYPPIYFFGELLPLEHIKGFHQRGDCFVLPHRAEGFGIPLAEAMSYGKPTISTGWSGNLEFMNEENSYLVRYQLTPVSGMLFPNYNGHMTWADPDVIHLREIMRHIVNNQEEAKQIGLNGQKTIKEKFNAQVIGKLIVDRLRFIQDNLVNKA